MQLHIKNFCYFIFYANNF